METFLSQFLWNGAVSRKQHRGLVLVPSNYILFICFLRQGVVAQIWNAPQIHVWMLGPPLVVLFWEVLETLAGGPVEENRSWGHVFEGHTWSAVPSPLKIHFWSTMRWTVSALCFYYCDIWPHHRLWINRAKDWGLKSLNPQVKNKIFLL
jgi:hypothetical protein